MIWSPTELFLAGFYTGVMSLAAIQFVLQILEMVK